MPLVKSKSPKAFKANVKAEIAAGKPQKQAVAIAYDVQRRAKKAGGGMISSDAQKFDSDLDYQDYLAGMKSKPRAPLPPSIKPNKADEARSEKMKARNERDTKIRAEAMKAGDKELAEKAFMRRHVRSRAEGLQSGAKKFPYSADKFRKTWSEEIGGGKPAPFKKGGKVAW